MCVEVIVCYIIVVFLRHGYNVLLTFLLHVTFIRNTNLAAMRLFNNVTLLQRCIGSEG